MNQTPQMPPNEPEPLDAGERELARMLRNLPSGSPPPELDARILGAARRAVLQGRPRQHGGWRSFAIGTAASALLAAGLFVKMHGTDQGAPPAAATADSEAGRAPEATPAAAADSAMPVAQERPARPVVESPAAKPVSVPAPPPPPPGAPPPAQVAADAGAPGGQAATDKPVATAFPSPPKVTRPTSPSVAPQAPTSPAPSNAAAPAAGYAQPPSPAAPPPPIAADHAQSKSDNQSTAKRDELQAPAVAADERQQDAGKDAQQATNSSPAAGGLTTGQLQPQEAAKAKELDSVGGSGFRSKRAAAEEPGSSAALSLDDDARLAPAQWLERIRGRLDANDQAGARDSLRRFRVRYPDAAIPDDLKPLLR